ncbi:hypothetical protein [Pelomicrobium methylotrophicum]|uniref:Uncharacterized protein n=1 Tax=Pelomicrobium methylotrophicum TaxID=2602750 RepID=A0A5C7EX82_9PROT|nr:hypothetical protein [Pelomicrobium methylotrophicum]TXF11870.1 hypothetical protein FR698_08840 [Pelomicrobium methylotrophicum]
MAGVAVAGKMELGVEKPTRAKAEPHAARFVIVLQGLKVRFKRREPALFWCNFLEPGARACSLAMT